MPFASLAKRACSLAFLALCLFACNASLKYIKFPVQEDGHTVKVTKFFNDIWSGNAEATNAFKAAQGGDFGRAIAIMKVQLQQTPDSEWGHYNLGILYEATGDFHAAEVEMKEAVRLDRERNSNALTKLFADELNFIQRRNGTAPSAPAGAGAPTSASR